VLTIPSHAGVDELETKILDVDRDALIERLRELGAVDLGSFAVTEQRYVANAQMEKHAMSTRLRSLVGAGSRRVELVLKRKLPPIPVPGHESLGPRLKKRVEFEVALEKTKGDASRFDVMRFMLTVYGLEERDRFVTNRLSYGIGEVRCELDQIVSYDNDDENLPPPFLEIEGPTADVIVATAGSLGYGAKDLSPLTKREVVEKFRKKKRKTA